MRPVAFLLVLGLFATPALAQDYYSDIRPILVENCLACHNAEGPGWSMEDAEETFQRRHMITAMVLGRQMPPWIAEGGHQEYLYDPSLGEAILDLFRDWRDGGFEAGPPPAHPAVAEGDAAHGSGHTGFQPDFSLEMLPGEAYLPNQARPDDYRCFVVDWPEDAPAYVTGFRARPGNLQVAHHTVIFAGAPEVASRFHELAAEEEDNFGYECFGGPVPDRLGQHAEREAYETRYPDGVRELDRSSFWLAHWAPGMDGHHFPEGTGILMEPGSVVIVQMHYFVSDAPNQRDAGTVVEFLTEPEVERPALHFPQTRNDWLAAERNGSLVVPPGGMATYEVSDRLGSLLPHISRVTKVEEETIVGLEIHSVNLHMHAFGQSGQVTLRDHTGRKETLLSVPEWDLRWQRDFTFVEPKVFGREELDGTSIAVECTFRNRTGETVYGGFGSYDEMCFNFAYIAVQRGEPDP